MTHTWTNPELPLSGSQLDQLVSGVLPSSEANFFDFSQLHAYNNGSGINGLFPSKNDPLFSGVILTYPPDVNVPDDLIDSDNQSGIFSPSGLAGPFSSNTPIPSSIGDRLQDYSRPRQREDYADGRNPSVFRVQDSYIHHRVYYDGQAVIEIPFLSNYNTVVDFNIYGNTDFYYNAGF